MRSKPDLKRNDHLLTVADLSREEILNIFALMRALKDAHKQGIQLPLLKDKVLGMMFEFTSTRTRISFETAMTQLGGHAEFLEMKTLHVGDNHETMRDTAEVISRMVDGVIMRCNSHAALELFAAHSFVPVFNGMTMDYHPTQAFADVFTMMEHLPHKPLQQITMMYLGDNNHEYEQLVPVQRELMRLAALLGMTYIACAPEVMQVCPADEETFYRLAAGNGAKLIKTTDPYEYISKSDFTVSDSFWMGFADDSPEAARRKALLYPKYSVDQKLVAAGPAHLGVLHCLPGMRNEEIMTEVWDGPHSLLFEEAENRLHAQKAILSWYMYDNRHKSQALYDYHLGKAEDMLNASRYRAY